MRKAERCISVYNTVISSNLLPERCATQRTNDMSFWRITRVRWMKEQKINWNKLLAFYCLLISKILQILQNTYFSFLFFFIFYYGEQNPYRAERMDGLYIGAVHYCKTHVNPPSQISSMLYPLTFCLCVVGFSVGVSDRSKGFEKALMYSVIRIC